MESNTNCQLSVIERLYWVVNSFLCVTPRSLNVQNQVFSPSIVDIIVVVQRLEFSYIFLPTVRKQKEVSRIVRWLSVACRSTVFNRALRMCLSNSQNHLVVGLILPFVAFFVCVLHFSLPLSSLFYKLLAGRKKDSRRKGRIDDALWFLISTMRVFVIYFDSFRWRRPVANLVEVNLLLPKRWCRSLWDFLCEPICLRLWSTEVLSSLVSQKSLRSVVFGVLSKVGDRYLTVALRQGLLPMTLRKKVGKNGSKDFSLVRRRCQFSWIWIIFNLRNNCCWFFEWQTVSFLGFLKMAFHWVGGWIL